MMKHLVVVPTYNEADNIKSFVEEIFKIYPEISVLVVDDSSPDGTALIVENLKSSYTNLYLLSQSKKGGLAKAYINGFKWGLANGFDLFTSIDADFSHPIAKIQEARKLIENGADVASASRYCRFGSTKETNFFKNFISRGGNVYARFVLGNKLSDWTEGFNTYKKEVLTSINLECVRAKGYVFQAEIKYKAIKNGFNIKEFPIMFEERQRGKSKMSLSIVLEAFFAVLRLKIKN